MIYDFVSAKTVISKVVRDLGIHSEEIPWQDYVEWIAEGLKHIGAFPQFVEKETELEITNYRADLPCDFYKPIRVYYQESQMAYNNHRLIEGADPVDYNYADYKFNNNTLTFGIKEGKSTLTYIAFPVDEENFPLVPDNQSYLDALFWKIVYQLSLRGYNFKQPYLRNPDYTRRKWNYYCLQSRGDAYMPNLQMQERIKNNWLSLIPRTSSFEQDFQNSGKRQYRLADGQANNQRI